jgi:uncharacterized membrane protein SirB2
LLVWLESSSVASWVSLSLWAYPALLTVHIFGLALVVGLYALRDFRLIGFFAGTNASLFEGTNLLSSFGIAINLVSGFLLFSSQATFLISSIPFLVKISCVALGTGVFRRNRCATKKWFEHASVLSSSVAFFLGDSNNFGTFNSLLLDFCRRVLGCSKL